METQKPIAPVHQTERLRILDVIRGIAVFGILLLNIPFFTMTSIQFSNLNVANEYSGPNYYTWLVMETFVSGSMRALFGVLFGAGCLLLIERIEKKQISNAADIHYRRMLWLFLFGMFHAYILLWYGDYLFGYALCGLFIYPFRNMKAKGLFLCTLLLLAFATAQQTYKIYAPYKIRVDGEQAILLEKKHIKLSEEQEENKSKWLAFQKAATTEELIKKVNKETSVVKKSNYVGLVDHFSTKSASFESVVLHQGLFLDMMVTIFLGMALFKWGIITGQRSSKFYYLLILVCLPVGILLSYWQNSIMVRLQFDNTRYLEHLFINWFHLKRLLLCVAYISILILMYRSGFLKKILNVFARPGQMAFTNYVTQSIICAVIFYGFNLYGDLQRYESYYVYAAVVLFQIIVSNIWLQYFRFGPFEWAWRSLTYWKKQPFLKQQSE